MPLSSEARKALGFLRNRYKVSEKDLVDIARKLQTEEELEESWEQITQRYLNRRRRIYGERGGRNA
jgi:hypothetical protein